MLKKKHHITSIGNVTMDMFFYTDEGLLIRNPADATKKKLLAFEYGAKLGSKDVYFCPGGGAGNTAATFANLGLKPCLLSSVGADSFGREIYAHMQKLHIPTDLLQIHRDAQTSFGFILGGRRWQDHVIFHHIGAAERLVLTPETLRKVSTPWIYLSALHGGRFSASLSVIMQRVSRQGIKLYWNPNPREIIENWTKVKKMLPLMEGLQLNFDETLEVLQARGQKVSGLQPKTAIKLLHEYGQNISVITNGDKGAYVYDGKKIYYKSATAVKIVSSTGAGDAFGSGFVTGLIRYQGNLSRALSLAMHNSAAVLAEVGAQKGLLTEKTLKRLNI